MFTRRTRLAAVAASLATLAVPASAAARTTLIGSGSSAEQPIMQLLFKAYSKDQHNKVVFSYNPDGGNAGVADVQHGKSQFAINTRPPLPSDSGTTQYKIFLDGLCIDVNSSNSLSNLALGDAKNIFLGTDTTWSQVPGATLTSTIDPVGRNSAAGLYTFFQSAVLGGKTQASNVLQEPSDGLVAQTVKNDPNAIGYVGLPNSTQSGIKPLSINGVACTQSTIKAGTYPLLRYAWAVLPTKSPNTAAEKFIDWVRTSAQAGSIINKAGSVAVFNKK